MVGGCSGVCLCGLCISVEVSVHLLIRRFLVELTSVLNSCSSDDISVMRSDTLPSLGESMEEIDTTHRLGALTVLIV